MADSNIFPDRIEYGEAEIDGTWYFGLRALETAGGLTSTIWLNESALRQVLAQLQFFGSQLNTREPKH
jgi:hypothetical protein